MCRSSNQFFQSFQFFLCCFLAEADPDAGDGNAHFQQAVVDAGVGGILRMPNIVQCQIGRDNQGLPAAVTAVYDVVNLFQCILRATFHSKIVNDERRTAAQPVHCSLCA